MNFQFAIFTVLVQIVLFTECAQPKVTVYYETLCPDTQRFFRTQFYPTYTKLQNEFVIDLVPYGKAIQNYVNNQWEFDCQHGNDECYGNKVQACLIQDNSVSESSKMKMINCIMSDSQPIYATNKCAELVGLQGPVYASCADSSKGDEYLAGYGNRTHALTPKLSFVPTIVINDTFKQQDQDLALRNFKQLICNYLGSAPQACK